MSNVTSPAAPVETDRHLATHRFCGGPYDCFTVTFPRRSILDDPTVEFVVIPRGMSIETGLAWNEIMVSALDPGPMPLNAVYRRVEPGIWQHVPLSASLKPQVGRYGHQ
jgi:hypothetical protein